MKGQKVGGKEGRREGKGGRVDMRNRKEEGRKEDKGGGKE